MQQDINGLFCVLFGADTVQKELIISFFITLIIKNMKTFKCKHTTITHKSFNICISSCNSRSTKWKNMVLLNEPKTSLRVEYFSQTLKLEPLYQICWHTSKSHWPCNWIRWCLLYILKTSLKGFVSSLNVYWTRSQFIWKRICEMLAH